MSQHKVVIYRPAFDSSGALPLNKYNSLLKSILVGNLCVYFKNGFTNISCRMFLKNINSDDIICTYIKSKVMSLPCFGIYSGVIMASFLERLFHNNDLGDVYELTANLEKIKIFLMSCIEEMKTKCDVDVIILVDSVSKILSTDFFLSNVSLKKLSLEVVKVVVSSMETDTLKLGLINVIIKNGKENFFATNGVICEVDDSNKKLIDILEKQYNILHKLLLIVEPITDISEILIEQMSLLDIKIVVCQKAISRYLKVILRRKNIIAIERVGEEIALSVGQLTSAMPISDLNFDTLDLVKYVGYFSKVSIIPINRQFISIENESNLVCSLFLSSWMLGEKADSKDIVFECIKLVYSMIHQPYILPGFITFEEKLIEMLIEGPVDNPVMKNCARWLIQILKDISKLGQIILEGPIKQDKSLDDCYFLKKDVLTHAINGIIEVVNIALVIEKNDKL